MRIKEHPILGRLKDKKKISITFDGKKLTALKGEVILSCLLANEIYINRYTKNFSEPRGMYCGIGLCSDCMMIVNGIPNVRTCVTSVEDGMIVETQMGTGDEK